MRIPLAALLLVLLATAGCTDPRKALEDRASCPGSTCTDDAQARYDAIAALGGVTDVALVSRSYGLDNGTSAHAEVAARVADRRAAYDVATSVLRELDAWPDREFGVAEATVVADPPVEVGYAERTTEDLTNPYFHACLPARCREALADLRRRMLAEIDGLSTVTLQVHGSTLRVSGRADADHYALAASGASRLVVDTALRLADRLEVTMTARGPLRLTLRLQDGLVCDEPAGTIAACDEDNAVPLAGS